MYKVQGSNRVEVIDTEELLSLKDALKSALSLREKGFEQIKLINIDTGVEITDLDQFIRENPYA